MMISEKRNIGILAVIHIVFSAILSISVTSYLYYFKKMDHQGEVIYLGVILFSLFVILISTIFFYKQLLNSDRKNKKTWYLEVYLIIFLLIIYNISKLIRRTYSQNYSIDQKLIVYSSIAILVDFLLLFFSVKMIGAIRSKRLLCLYQGQTNRIDITEWSPSGKNMMRIQQALDCIAEGNYDIKLDPEDFNGQQRDMVTAINNISSGLQRAVQENTKNERLKADLITNVSHDIKTPLTSIINYISLLKNVKIQDEKAKNYIRIIDEKATRLKNLTEDLVEASKISSGNIKLDMTVIDFMELLYQTGGEFNDRFEDRNLTIVTKITNESFPILADGRQLYRVLENLYTNASKYALEGTKVYVELSKKGDEVVFSMRNMIANPGFVNSDLDLTERFTRGDESRTTEGSGLGLSIAKNLTRLMGGEFDVETDAEWFAVTIIFKTS